jgi:hypothetical protein
VYHQDDQIKGNDMGVAEGRRTLKRSRRRWEDNIKMSVTEEVCDIACISFVWLRIGICDRLL